MRRPSLWPFACLLVCLSSAAWAQDLPNNFCQALVQHVPDADVAYQPGVDVHGHAVAPADLPDSAGAGKPWPVQIPLTARLFKVLKLPTANFPFQDLEKTDINLGTLSLDGDRVLLNGSPLSDAQQANLAVLCLRPKGQPVQTPTNLLERPRGSADELTPAP